MKKSLENQPEIVSKKRNPSVDIVKGVASIGVVIIHASSYMDDTLSHVYLKAMGRFSVPIFVFFFVYFFSRSLEGGKVLALTQNKIISLAKPYLIWTIFYLLLDFVVTGKSLSSDFETMLDADTWINQGWAGQYFFFVLFESVLLTVLLRLLKTKQLIVITTFTVFLNTAIVYYPKFHVIRSLGYLPPYTWIPYICLGIVFGRSNNKENTSNWLKLAAMVSPILIAFELSLTVRTEETFVYLFPSVFICSFLIMKGGFSCENILLANIFSKIGKSSMAVFCLNPFLIPVINNISPIVTDTWPSILALSALVIFASILVEYQLCKIPLFLHVFGKC